MMETTIKALFEAEIEKTLEEIAQAKTGSDASLKALDKLNKLHQQYVKESEIAAKNLELTGRELYNSMELDQKRAEAEGKLKQALDELAFKKEELALKSDELQEAKRGRRWRTLLDILGISVPVIASGYWMKRGLEFESEGKLYSSRTGQWLAQHLRLFGKKG